mmetsp:Transcript_34827/g.26001  ORF Transcript_34827/g.26001 Transcript_34827/m.26001 type:complete len:172 (-) Transcript_34827:339-854(-)|eukprot:CAMPEP_0202957866 /NCGR_PEP_ID=MMETSP1396-20130829/2250_1 /ASSEMBLY_ACC=CAM_ASM_000872 /TAXON_ID= /ORGANISM="Pseudokeronopsis sp., Strain Brazil" /LENGTH=171 /DNA_ID=CAMNT_0049675589 /DNA_START=17 /DNA_END=532 /DNA_ORIENTATION=+
MEMSKAEVQEEQSMVVTPSQEFKTPNRHSLQTNWCYWYLQRQMHHSENDGEPLKKVTYRDRLKSLGTISTVEQFFEYYVYMKRPSEMAREIDLYFFREGEVPMWEDSPFGGIWILKVKKEDDIDKMWELLLMALIGEQFEEPKVIGLGLSLRTKERLLEVWLKDGRNEKVR